MFLTDTGDPARMSDAPSPPTPHHAPDTPAREAGAHRAGFVAVVGRANVGKSTLVNQLLPFKVSAVSPRPQTTQTRILGILTGDDYQIAFLDTPGHLARIRDELDRRMVREATRAITEADLVVLMVEPRPPGDIERFLLERIRARQKPAILVVNKVDTVKKPLLLPIMEAYSQLYPFLDLVPVSATQRDGVDLLLQLIVKHLPPGEPLFPPDQATDRSQRFLVAEAIREVIYHLYRQELPYATAVTIEAWREASPEHGGKTYIAARIHPEKESQRAILVGREGQALKQVGVQAREEIEAMLGRPVYLELWVKPRARWRKDQAFLKRLGH